MVQVKVLTASKKIVKQLDRKWSMTEAEANLYKLLGRVRIEDEEWFLLQHTVIEQVVLFRSYVSTMDLVAAHYGHTKAASVPLIILT